MWTCFICSHDNNDTLTVCAGCHKSKKHSSVDYDTELGQLDFSSLLKKIERYLAAPLIPPSLKHLLVQDRIKYSKLKQDYDQAAALAGNRRYPQAIQLFSLIKAQLSNAPAQAIIDGQIFKAEQELKKIVLKRRRRVRSVTTVSTLISVAALLVAVGLPYLKVKRLESKAEMAAKNGNYDDAIMGYRELIDITGSEKFRAKGLSMIELKNRKEQETLATLDMISRLIDDGKLEEALSMALPQEQMGKEPRLVRAATIIKDKISARDAEVMRKKLSEITNAIPPALISKARRYGINRMGAFEITLMNEMTMVRIMAGDFMMGVNGRKSDRIPSHRVHLSEYWIGTGEITSDQFSSYAKEIGVSYGAALMNKVTSISWDTADRFCEWLSNRTGLKFSLPTEAQWENAAIMSNTPYDSGNPDLANVHGLSGMYDEIREWCSDFFDKEYYSMSKANDPKGPEIGDYHDVVVRGSSKRGGDGRPDFRLRFKASLSPKFKSDKIGFRVVMQ